jgi:integrase
MIGLEWTDVDLGKRQLCIQRSEWRGHVTVPKGGRLRFVPMTGRLAKALHQDLLVENPGPVAEKRSRTPRLSPVASVFFGISH